MVLKIGILGGANISRKVSRAINTIPDVAEGRVEGALVPGIVTDW